LIKNGVITPIDLRRAGHGSEHIRELIGDTTCQCFAVRADRYGHRMLVGHCDDNFIQKELALNVVLTADLYNHPPPGYPICGPIVVTAVVAPNTASMTLDEMARFVTVGPLLHYVRDA